MTFTFVLLISILACIPHRHHFVTVRSAVVGTPSEVVNAHPTALNWSITALIFAFTLAYDATLGPICYALVSEMPSTRLRSKTIVLARNCYNIPGIVTNIITPRMLYPTAWGWGAKAGFFWAGTSVLGILWSWWRLPEPKGRTLVSWMSSLRGRCLQGSSRLQTLLSVVDLLREGRRVGYRTGGYWKGDCGNCQVQHVMRLQIFVFFTLLSKRICKRP